MKRNEINDKSFNNKQKREKNRKEKVTNTAAQQSVM
jgi:hypothetical protein